MTKQIKYSRTDTTYNTGKSFVFWDITLCSPLKVNRRLGGTYRLCLQVDEQAKQKKKTV
jgi:hypothetical protein